MNEEENKAVEILNTFEFRSKTRNYKEISLEDSKSVKIVLNLIEKLQKENEELRAKWDKDTHILQNKLDYANADRIDLAQQNKELRKENEELNYKLHSKKIALEIYNRYIPKSKLKDIIDRIDYDIKKTKEIISKNTNIHASYRKK